MMNETTSVSIEEVLDQLTRLNLSLSHALLQDIAHTLAGGIEGNADMNRTSGEPREDSHYNCIPGFPSTHCHPELVVYCFDKDSLTGRVADLVAHVVRNCPETRRAVLVTSRWNPNIWRRNQDVLSRAAAEIIVILTTPFGPVRIA